MYLISLAKSPTYSFLSTQPFSKTRNKKIRPSEQTGSDKVSYSLAQIRLTTPWHWNQSPDKKKCVNITYIVNKTCMGTSHSPSLRRQRLTTTLFVKNELRISVHIPDSERRHRNTQWVENVGNIQDLTTYGVINLIKSLMFLKTTVLRTFWVH